MEMLKIYRNTLPLSTEVQRWQDDNLRPDFMPWHYPEPNGKVKTVLRENHDDERQAYRCLVVWLINEAAFDQLYRQPQVSHLEYDHVVKWCLEIEAELNLYLPAALTGMTVSGTLEECGWFELHWSRYPDFIIGAFDKAGWHIQQPFDSDPRHIDYKSPKSLLLALSSPD